MGGDGCGGGGDEDGKGGGIEFVSSTRGRGTSGDGMRGRVEGARRSGVRDGGGRVRLETEEWGMHRGRAGGIGGRAKHGGSDGREDMN